jgi:4a-hydroxytetrahydrobiopterin dehydratase
LSHLVEHWEIVNKTLYRKFNFKDFKDAFNFIKKVAILAEQQNHHPNWKNNYNVVEIELKTHESNQITNKDILLANSINNIDTAK